VQKLILPSILALGFLIIGFSSFQDAYAVLDCSSAALEANTLYIGTAGGELFKLNGVTGENCLIGEIKRDTSGLEAPATAPAMQPNIICKDIAIDHPTGTLYCLDGGFFLRTIGRTVDGSGFIDSDLVGTLVDITASANFNNANALEIDSQGRAYLAGAGNQASKFYNLDLTNAEATLRIDFDPSSDNIFVSSGDLARDEQTPNHLYQTIECLGLVGEADACDDSANDRLYRILLNTPGCVGPCADTLVPLEELVRGEVFALDIAQPTGNLCYLNVDGWLFETDTDGNAIGSPRNVATGEDFSGTANSLLLGFGASGNNIGGTIIMINTMALLIAAGQTNPTWLILLAISGVAVVAYQFKDKIKSKNKRINE